MRNSRIRMSEAVMGWLALSAPTVSGPQTPLPQDPGREPQADRQTLEPGSRHTLELGGSKGTASAPIVSGRAGERIDAYLQARSAGGFSGTAMIVRQDKIILQKGYGMADRAKNIANTPETVFEIASLSKQFTAAAVFLLAQDGKLKVDDRMADHLEGVPQQFSDVTIYHLLTHTSGLPSASGALRGMDLARVLPEALRCTPLAPPGEEYHYSNLGYALLSSIVEQASGMRFEEFCHKRLFGPAEMKSTGFCGETLEGLPLALGYSGSGMHGRVPNVDPYAPADQFGFEYRGMGGVCTSAIDLLAWERVLQSDNLLNRETKERLFTPYKGNYACGWEVFRFSDGRECIGHGGDVRGYHCKMWRFPDDSSIIVVLSNNTFDYGILIVLYEALFDTGT